MCFLQLPFGLKVSSKWFQSAIYGALHGLTGVNIIADDILIIGKGDIDEAAIHDHDKKPYSTATVMCRKANQAKQRQNQIKMQRSAIYGK